MLLLLFDDSSSDVPVEKDGLMGDGASGGDACGNHPGLQFFDELPIVGADDDGIQGFFHGVGGTNR